jgi:hypothetical protein
MGFQRRNVAPAESSKPIAQSFLNGRSNTDEIRQGLCEEQRQHIVSFCQPASEGRNPNYDSK